MPIVAYAPRAPRTPTLAEQQKILKVSGEHAAGYRDHMLFSFALACGLREAELAALNVGDVMSGRTPRPYLQLQSYKGRGKTKKPAGAERVPLNRTLRRKLVKFIAWKKKRGEPVGPDAPLFVTIRPQPSGTVGKNLQRIADRTIRHSSQKWQKKAGIDRPFNFHAFRHACLTNAYNLKKDIRFVQTLARHKDVKVTALYTHMSDEELAREVDRLPC